MSGTDHNVGKKGYSADGHAIAATDAREFCVVVFERCNNRAFEVSWVGDALL